MAGKRRLGVAVLLDPPVADEVNGLRRAVGDPSLARIPPHVTLVPPVNVRSADLAAALAVLQRAAAVTRPAPLTLSIGAVSTFLPVNPVLYLGVAGDLEGLRTLRDAVFRGPLERRLSWPWVPHVTLADGTDEARIEAALAALGDYTAQAVVDRVVLLEEGPGRRWSPLADAALGPPARVGTGGLVVELVRGRLVDPRLENATATTAPPPVGPPVVVNAYREGQPVGWARAAPGADGTPVEVFVVEEHRRQGIGGHLRAHIHWALSR
ncbi:MAG TPA: GNAT family N-acetyltransferase [Acidimicrobiales bacterium]|nr:GNAT family N-acetyltransferase [Acidimicrobiales bacterium]